MSAADQRITMAREFLAGARRRKVSELPPSVLMREDAELRRLLGQVLDVVDEQAPGVLAGNVDLTRDQLATVGRALGDAERYRLHRGTRMCEACESTDGLCGEHAADMDLADAYARLGAELGLAADSSGGEGE